jgi:putative molybdopterin biosynthesis protein
MRTIQSLHTLERLKCLADPRRLRILQVLMTAPASLTMVGKTLGESPAWVRHHLVQLEAAGLVELSETRINGRALEKYYRACADGYLLQQMILPDDPSHPTVVFSGSHDLAVEMLAEYLSPHLNLLTLPVGSLDGLMTLRQNLSQVAGCHLLDVSGEFNLPFVNRIFPDRDMHVITLAYREQGLLTASGNPRSIRELSDLARADLRFINRNPGSGTRLWLDHQLHTQGISPKSISGYDNQVSTHTECARLVGNGSVDTALALRASANRFGLGFIPLFHERYDLVFPREMSPHLAPLLDTLQTPHFRRQMDALAGYETAHTGESILK